MSVDVVDKTIDVDLSKLIDLSVTFQPLQLTIKDIYQRLVSLEAANAAKDQQIAALNDALQQLQEKEAARASATDDVEALWEEIQRINELLGELQVGAERDRHTIDEIYAARKRKNSVQPGGWGEGSSTAVGQGGSRETTSLAPPVSGGSSQSQVRGGRVMSPLEGSVSATGDAERPMGDMILQKAHEALELAATVAYPSGLEAETGSETERSRSYHSGSAVGPLADSDRTGVSISLRTQSVVDGPHGPTARPLSGSILTTHHDGDDAGERMQPQIVSDSTGRAEEPFPPSQWPPMEKASRRPGSAPRRQSQQRKFSGRPSISVFDKLRRDGDDIAYLNRVVAEILGEMKGLHEDVDFLRTYAGKGGDGEEDSGAAARRVSRGGLNDVERRLGQLEAALKKVDTASQRRDSELAEALRVARGLTDEDLAALRRCPALADRTRDLEDRLRPLEAAQNLLKDQFNSIMRLGDAKGGDGAPSSVNPLQFAAMQGAVDNLQKQVEDLLQSLGVQAEMDDRLKELEKAVRDLVASMADAQSRLQHQEQESARLEDEKANKADVGEKLDILTSKLNDGLSGAEARERLKNLVDRLTAAEEELRRLDEEKADRSGLQKLREDLAALRQLMEMSDVHGRDGGSEDGGAFNASTEKMLRDLHDEVGALKETHRTEQGMSGDVAEELREMIDRLDHCKADATLVANKAERDYVENALERLMREVEQVLNATNAGLIDTLEKSLNILRDMIDGKATKQDVANLQNWMADANVTGGGSGGAADGLTGFKGYRCLGCNRAMDSMRPRTLPTSMNPFLNRTPQNYPQDNVTRTIQQQQQALLVHQHHHHHSQSGATSPIQRGDALEGSLQRSVQSEPLPPIDHS